MKVLVENASCETVIKNSRFIAEAFIVGNQSEARDVLREQKSRYSDATHVCHAFITGPKAETSGMSDDGEPSGTAGRPMLDVLKGSGIMPMVEQSNLCWKSAGPRNLLKNRLSFFLRTTVHMKASRGFFRHTTFQNSMKTIRPMFPSKVKYGRANALSFPNR